MNSITVHNIDNSLMALIRSKAKEKGQSLNKTIKDLLERSLGVRLAKKSVENNPFKEFCGIWSSKELADFQQNTGDNNSVDPGDWQ